jgi:excisionase family DNA binding protein
MKNAIEITFSDELLDELTKAVKQAVKEELPKYQNQFRKNWLSTDEVMELLDVSRKSVSNYRKEGTISYTQLAPGGKILYPREEIEAFLRENMVYASNEQLEEGEHPQTGAINPFLEHFR